MVKNVVLNKHTRKRQKRKRRKHKRQKHKRQKQMGGAINEGRIINTLRKFDNRSTTIKVLLIVLDRLADFQKSNENLDNLKKS